MPVVVVRSSRSNRSSSSHSSCSAVQCMGTEEQLTDGLTDWRVYHHQFSAGWSRRHLGFPVPAAAFKRLARDQWAQQAERRQPLCLTGGSCILYTRLE